VDRRLPEPALLGADLQGGAAWRKRLMDDLGDQGDVTALIDRRSDAELAALMENLGGNCVATLAEAFAAVDHDRPTCFLAYTIKGWGTPSPATRTTTAGLMTKAQMAEWQQAHGRARRAGMGALRRGSKDVDACGLPRKVPFFARRAAALRTRAAAGAGSRRRADREISTQPGFGKILDELARGDSRWPSASSRPRPTSPVTTNLGPG
jgi:pyruvate dehydrogenase E1 component